MQAIRNTLCKKFRRCLFKILLEKYINLMAESLLKLVLKVYAIDFNMVFLLLFKTKLNN